MMNTKHDSTSKILDLITCPISKIIMRDPVQAADGYTYERAYMEKLILDNKDKEGVLSPVTKELLPNINLIPNITLKAVIDIHMSFYPMQNINSTIMYDISKKANNYKYEAYCQKIKNNDYIEEINLADQDIGDKEINNIIMLLQLNHISYNSVQIVNLTNTNISIPCTFELPKLKYLNVQKCVNLINIMVNHCPELISVNATLCPNINLTTKELDQWFKNCPKLDGEQVYFKNNGLSEQTIKHFNRNVKNGTYLNNSKKDKPVLVYGI